ncbi:MAG: PGPGW domain-containing protein [Bdellovibrionota bacterium]
MEHLLYVKQWMILHGTEVFAFSALFFLIYFIGTIAFFVLIPSDYFLLQQPSIPLAKFTWTEKIIFLLRNFFAVLVIAVGVALLFLPGQGLLTILMGLAISDFSKKRFLIIAFLHRQAVIKTINHWRKKYAKAPLQVPDHE